MANIFKGSFVPDTSDETQADAGEPALGWLFHRERPPWVKSGLNAGGEQVPLSGANQT